MLKAGRYRSAAGYISRAKDRHVELGFVWSDDLGRAAARAGRSATRGIGPARQSQALPFQELAKLPDVDEPTADEGPIGARRLLIVGSLFCTREIEIALAKRSHITVDEARCR
eukprot:15872937-Heterocapsa_arctica.AAC.1